MNELNILKELTVLYVDDDKEACQSLQEILKYYFKDILIAHNGQEALDIFQTQECHFLIADYDMPIMDGYEFLSKVRKLDEQIPAIIMSSYDDKVKLKNAIKLNLIDYIVKPYELDELQEVLQKVAARFQSNSSFQIKIAPNCFYDKILKQIITNDTVETLTSFEIKVLEYFIKHKQKVIRYEELLDILDSSSQKSLISIIYKINNKFSFKILHNIKDVGYILK